MAELPCDLWDGELHLDGKLFQMIPIPLEHEGDVQLDLECMEKVHILGTAIRLELSGEAEYVEECPGR